MTHSWYVLHTKPRKEGFLAEQLGLRRMEFFNPQIRVNPVNPRAMKVRPYFPGYVFVHLDLRITGTGTMQYLPGAAGLVAFGGEPADVPDGLVHAIRHRVDEINRAGGELFEVLTPGESVVIHSGPFAGYGAIFDASLPGTDRVRVLLRLLKNRQMPVDLPAGFVRPNK